MILNVVPRLFTIILNFNALSKLGVLIVLKILNADACLPLNKQRLIKIVYAIVVPLYPLAEMNVFVMLGNIYRVMLIQSSV